MSFFISLGYQMGYTLQIYNYLSHYFKQPNIKVVVCIGFLDAGSSKQAIQIGMSTKGGIPQYKQYFFPSASNESGRKQEACV
jgi:hypothetical protein